MLNSHFAKFPQINLPRSRFKITFNHKLSMMHGYLTPIDCREILPGDTFDAKKIASLIHMSTPIVPFMDNIDMYVRCFFVPTRLIWNNFEQFMGANKGAGYQTVVPTFPSNDCCLLTNGANLGVSDLRLNLSHLLGKPVQTFSNARSKLPKPLSVLKERGFYEIWNNYFRAEQLQGEFPVDKGDGLVITSGGITFNVARVLLTDNYNYNLNYDIWQHTLPKVNKKHDYFVSCTLSPQYGPSVTLPLGTEAPVYVDIGTSVIPVGEQWPIGVDEQNTGKVNLSRSGVSGNVTDMSAGAAPSAKIYTDLSVATAATINSLRYAFAVQRYLERSNYGSNHFYEILAVHYGVSSPDARLQRPEYLGGFHYRINVDQVLNMDGKTDTSATVLGKKGAVSVTADRHFGFTKGFVEPGYLYVLAYTKQDRTYSDMVLKEDLKTNRFEFYSPEFANLGDQEVLKFELQGSEITDDVFGYQEAWGEYRFAPSRVSGDLNPSIPGAMPYWSLADSYKSSGSYYTPSLGPTWIQEDRDAVARALATGTAGPDFLADWYIEYVAARLMPVYSIPGLIDHVGAM